MGLFSKKKLVNKESLCESITKAIVDDSKISLKRFINFLKGKRRFDDVIKNPDEKDIINYTIFIFFLESIALSNLFPKIKNELLGLSILCLSKELNHNKEKILENIKIYDKKYNEYVKAGVDPFRPLGIVDMLCEKLNFKKTVTVGRTKTFNPIFITVFSGFIIDNLGRWKKVKNSYKIK